MGSQGAAPEGLFEAISGSGHLDWSDFRENVLRTFRIRCVTSTTADQFPKPFLAELQAAQKNTSNHDAQRQAWRLDVAAGRGLTSLAVFPPNLVPPQVEASQTIRCMLPRMSREGLPLRLPSAKGSLYELPTAKPIYVFGFDMDIFKKSEQVHLMGPLSATGVLVDYLKGEVLPCKTLCCPYLTFEKFNVNNKRQIETARNSCAITGAQCLRGQQQLFHKASGLESALQPLITFSCALNNEHAIINYHYIDDDGDYTMAPLCKFDLQNDEHFNTFQTWIQAIDGWATTHLLPRIQVAISQVIDSNPTPPPSPSPTNSSLLSIDTRSSDVLSILKELRRLCPTRVWRNDSMTAETPINSSIAICGTPLPTREMRGLALPKPSSSGCTSSDEENEEPTTHPLKPRNGPSDILSPLSTNFPPSSSNRPRGLSQHVYKPSPSSRTPFSPYSDSSTPISPCRPPTLSPCTPGPDMPMSSMNPILVLQRRLDVAACEINELRVHNDELQEQLNSRTASLEQKLKLVTEKQEDSQKSIRKYIESLSLNMSDKEAWTKVPDEEQEMKTPTGFQSFSNKEHGIPIRFDADAVTEVDVDVTPPSLPQKMPGHYERSDNEDDTITWTWPQSSSTQDFLIWCLAKLLKDDTTQLTLLVSMTLMMCYTRLMLTHELCANMSFLIIAHKHAVETFWRWFAIVRFMVNAARDLQLDGDVDGQTQLKYPDSSGRGNNVHINDGRDIDHKVQMGQSGSAVGHVHT